MVNFVVNGLYSPGQVHNIKITRGAEKYESEIELDLSEDHEFKGFEARLQRHTIVKDLREVPKVA